MHSLVALEKRNNLWQFEVLSSMSSFGELKVLGLIS
jgi:hypothetical protein